MLIKEKSLKHREFTWCSSESDDQMIDTANSGHSHTSYTIKFFVK